MSRGRSREAWEGRQIRERFFAYANAILHPDRAVEAIFHTF